jgi:hypothetical protein
MSNPTYIIGSNGSVGTICPACNAVMMLWDAKPIRIGKLIKTQVVETVKDEFTGSYVEVSVTKYIPRVKTVDGCPACQNKLGDLQLLENKRQRIYAKYGQTTNERQPFIEVATLPQEYKPAPYIQSGAEQVLTTDSRRYSAPISRESLLDDLVNGTLTRLSTIESDHLYGNMRVAGHMAISLLGWRQPTSPNFFPEVERGA